MTPTRIKITNCQARGPAFMKLTPGSIHDVIEPPEGYDNSDGVWVMGIMEPVKVLKSEYEVIPAGINLYHTDCMEFMAAKPRNYYDLAIVAPPYFSGPEKREYYGNKVSSIGIVRVNYPVTKAWQVPKEDYFNELFRVSKHQIVWGCNYFQYPFGPGRIVWDKVNGDTSFSDCELAYTSKHDSVRMFRFMWNGMQQGRNALNGHIMQGNKKLNEKRIHPTQKPVDLYSWLLTKYANPGDRILDTHGGSGSICIACHNLNYDLDWCEITQEYYSKASKRLKLHTSQLRIF